MIADTMDFVFSYRELVEISGKVYADVWGMDWTVWGCVR